MLARTHRSRLLQWPLLFGLCLAATLSHACLWDSDTLQQERSRFPSTLELIVGKFLRHGPEFYRWRTQQRQASLQAGDRRPEHYDDLGVAQDKLGNSLAAIDWMQRKEELFPGRYETYANLGTFHIHAGNLEEGARWIRKALEQNPDAHFGREKYQLLLVEYLLQEPAETDDASAHAPMGFARFLAERQTQQQQAAAEEASDPASPTSSLERAADQDAEWPEAIQGIQGMMRFGRHDSPVLLEALGDLLTAPQDQRRDARLLAARAYLRAAAGADEQRKPLLRKKADSALSLHEHVELAEVEAELAEELAQAEQWFEDLMRREQQWIADPDVDPEEEFNKLYGEPLAVSNPAPQTPTAANNPWGIQFRAAAVAFVVLLLGVGLAVFKSVQSTTHRSHRSH